MTKILMLTIWLLLMTKMFSRNLTAQEIKKYQCKNLMPANVTFKLLERYGYLQLLRKLDELLDELGEVSSVADVVRVKAAFDVDDLVRGEVTVESAIDEMTGSGAAGAYDGVPFPGRGVRRKKRKLKQPFQIAGGLYNMK